MKRSAILCLSAFLSSCVAPIFFEESQPSMVEAETRFMEQYLGDYINYEDSAYLTILDSSILIDKRDLGEEEIDTLFSISAENVLKFYKGKYFLNYRDDENDWTLHLIDLDRGVLSFYCFNIPDDDEKIEKLGTVRREMDECGEVVKLVIRPTKRGFRKLLKNKNLVRLGVFNKLDN